MSETLEGLLARCANVQLFIIFMRPTALHDLETEEGKALLTEHLQWQFSMEERGILLGAGPLDWLYETSARPERPQTDAFGISIVAASSREKAEEIAATEPFTRVGWREIQVVSWHLNEGVGAPLARQLVEQVD